MSKLINKIFSIFGFKISKIFKDKIKNPFPIEAKDNIKDIIKICIKYSMTGEKRMYVLSEAIKEVKRKNLEGDFVECGIWKGGNIILFQKLNNLFNLKKKIFAFDTFEGMPAPNEFDKDSDNVLASDLMLKSEKNSNLNNIHCYSPYEDVVNNISKHVDIANIKFIKGKVEETLLDDKNLPEKISILRLDTDFYSSTKIELEILYKRLVKGGILIIDDYGHWKGVRKAVDEFFNDQEWLHYVDYTCRYIIKK